MSLFCSKQCYNNYYYPTFIFCDIPNNQSLGQYHQPWPLAWLTTSTLRILSLLGKPKHFIFNNSRTISLYPTKGYFVCLLGSFGNGVLSYFTFLKWLLQLNIYIFILTLCFVVIPQAISTGEELPLESPQNVSVIKPNSSSSLIPAELSVSFSRRRRDVSPNSTEKEDNNKQCHLVKPENYSLYTHKPFLMLLSDFISGVVSRHTKKV